ncbi:MAG TPA: hypothetical protein VF021_08215 [Longimicrobiales bacterium]
MEALIALWIPIVLAAAIMFIASSIAWAALPHHKKDWAKLPNEAAVAGALEGVDAGQYMLPHGTMAAGWWAGILLRRGPAGMGRSLVLHFLNELLIAILAGYLAYYAIAPEADYLQVFRIAGTALVLGQIGALYSRAIWFGWRWRAIIVETVEGISYALLAAGVFGWWWVR